VKVAFARTAAGRADLARLIDARPPERLLRAAAALGFEQAMETRDWEMQGAPEAAVPEPIELPHPVAVPAAPTAPAAPMPFWRMETMTFTGDPESPSPAPEQKGGLTQDDLESPHGSLFATPASPPLASWSRLWPVLRRALQTSIPSREPDIPAMVRVLCQGELVDRIPRVARRAWPGRASIWVDRSARLIPFWSDQVDVCRRLRKVCDQSGLQVRLLNGRTQAWSVARRGDLLAGFRPDAGSPVAVLGDLGMFGSDADRAAWLRTARRLQHAGVRLSALVPSPPGRWHSMSARSWNAIPWERGRQRRAIGVRGDSSVLQDRAERLLRLISPAALVQPGLLRALRLLLPPWQADASTEADVWSHADVRAADATGLVLHPEAADRRRKEFAAEVDADLKTRVSQAIGQWHGALPKELLRAETLVWHALVPDIDTPGQLDDALGFAERLKQSLLGGVGGPELSEALKRYGRMLLRGMPAAIYPKVPGLQMVWAASFREMSGPTVPEGIDPSALYATLERAEAPRGWGMRQVGSELVCSLLPANGAWPSHIHGPGSPMAWFSAARNRVWITRGGSRQQLLLHDGVSIPLPTGQAELELRTDRSVVQLKQWRREPWAAAAGRDRFGLWADADIKGVVQRFRWIPPGRFKMGSPRSEAGRWTDEAPQHVVTWTHGRWLADTPVTQALWQSVMGDNPCRFQSSDRPVENVSWHDCELFLNKLRRLMPKFECRVRLPTEAEWEYACRAGTETTTWLGDLVIRGENDGPLLDTIAWYGGNCGVEYELDQGHDTTNWPAKQYDHTMGGSHPVGRRDPNPFAIYDMLGNVYEWCMDGWSMYASTDSTDPPALARTSFTRIVRGGSWNSNAAFIRAAHRHASLPGGRHGYVGFRLARGPAPGSEVEPGSRVRPPSPSRGTRPRPGR
jgi:formylglycine-generating enzyme required for sulfatase activity